MKKPSFSLQTRGLSRSDVPVMICFREMIAVDSFLLFLFVLCAVMVVFHKLRYCWKTISPDLTEQDATEIKMV